MANTVFDDILGELRMGDTASGGSGGASLVGGYRTSIAGGTASFVPSADIVTVTGTSVTLHPDTAYKIYATSQAITLNANPPAAGKWAYEGHLEIFVAGTGYVVTGTNVVLANALEPDSVNNCTVRFHDGIAIIAVEDHIAGYVVVSATGTTAGTLPYALTSATQEYVAFDASLNGTTIPLAGAIAEGEKHVVGNGYTETAITGAVNCGTSKFTVANLGLQNVQITGGTMTLGDVNIPNGATVAVSGGGLAIEKVTGAGSESVIDLGGTNVVISSGGTAYASACTFSGGSATYGGAILASGALVFSGLTVSGNSAVRGGGIYASGGVTVKLTNCIVDGNTATDRGQDIVQAVGVLETTGCTVGEVYLDSGASMVLEGNETITNRVRAFIPDFAGRSGSITISPGAILDLTGNTNATPIAPGGGITFEAGGATVLYGSGAVSGSYMMDNVTLPAGAKLTNTAIVNLGGSNVVINSGASASASGATFTSGSGANGGAFFISNGSLTLSNCVVSGNSASTLGAGAYITGGGTLILDNSQVIDRIDARYGARMNINNATIGAVYFAYPNSTTQMPRVEFSNSNNVRLMTGFGAAGSTNYGYVTISSGASINLTSSIESYITVLEGGCTVNGNVIPAGSYTKINSDGTTE